MQKSSIVAKTHRAPDGRVLLALCDSELLGHQFSEGKLQLDLTSGFYKGTEISDEEARRLLTRVSFVHAVGKRSCGILAAAGYEPKEIIIQGIPHAQLIMI